MLSLALGEQEIYDEVSETFSTLPAKVFRFEHSLVSLSKWESIHEIPFLDGKQRTSEEILSYIQCMCLDGLTDVDLVRFDQKMLSQIIAYIDSKQTATTFANLQQPRGRKEIITSEVVYYWMVTYNIPFSCDTWHLNRLFTLIRVCNAKAGKPKKMSRSELAAQTRALNEQRRRELGSKG